MGIRIGLAALLAATGVAGQESPRQGWQFAFKDFLIAAWSPPADTDAEYRLYRQAGFNVVMSVRHKLPDQALALARNHGLKVLVDTYTPHDQPWGGTAAEYTPHPSHHPATLPELEWLHARYGTHPALAGYLLGDDYGALPQELVDTTRFLREKAPHLFPWVCQNVMSAESLARAGNPIQDPQIYPTLYQADWPAQDQCRELCQQLQQLRAGCRRHDLIPWPMFNVCGVESDSLLRFQVYASLAYGAQGIWYFTYRDGLQKGAGYETLDEAKAHLLPSWAVAAEANRRVAARGPRLLGRTASLVFHTGWPASGGVDPRAGRLVEAMSEDLAVGILTKAGAPPLAMVVDKRADKRTGVLPARPVEVRLAKAVAGVQVLEGKQARAVKGSVVRLKLPAGGGHLLALSGRGLDALCDEGRLRAARRRTGKVGPEGLLLHLRFDERSGEIAKDASGLDNHVRLCGARWCQGRTGGGLSLELKGRFARLWDADLPARDAMSVAAWVRPKYPFEGYAPVILIGSGGCDRMEFGFGPDNLYPVITDQITHSQGQLYVAGMRRLISEGAWGHVAICAGPQGATTYVNGSAVAWSSYPGRFDFVAKEVLIGIRGGEEYDGDIDDLRVWNRCLGPEELQALAAGAPSRE